MDEAYVRVKGSWKYLYRAVDKTGATVDFRLTAKRDRKAAPRFLSKAIRWKGTPKKITIDKSGTNTAAIESHNAGQEAGIEIRQIKYLNNLVEQDHRAIKRQLRPMLGFKSFRSAAITLAGVELMHMIRMGQLSPVGRRCASIASIQFASGINLFSPVGIARPSEKFATEPLSAPAQSVQAGDEAQGGSLNGHLR
jgi:putative transposase